MSKESSTRGFSTKGTIPFVSIKAKVLADTICPNTLTRITTFETLSPRFIQAELKTHGSIRGNGASSRAIPTAKLSRLNADFFAPHKFTRNQKGMSAKEVLNDEDQQKALEIWNRTAKVMLEASDDLSKLGVHKQHANRLQEPVGWISNILTGTEDSWAHFFNLRVDSEAQPEMIELACKMLLRYEASEPTRGTEHVAMVSPEEVALLRDLGIEPFKISAARCARISYANHDTGEIDYVKDIELADRLLSSGHWTPFEHQAFTLYGEQPDAVPTPVLTLPNGDMKCGPYLNWCGYRYTFATQFTPTISRRTWNQLDKFRNENPELFLEY